MKYTIDIDDEMMNNLVVKYIKDSIDFCLAVDVNGSTLSHLLGVLDYILSPEEYKEYCNKLVLECIKE